MENRQVFHAFKELLNNPRKSGGIWKFSAKVIYKWKGKDAQENLDVSLFTDNMNITLSEGKKIYTPEHFMSFEARYENYSLSLMEEGFLQDQRRGWAW
jgi:hypothetical protein